MDVRLAALVLDHIRALKTPDTVDLWTSDRYGKLLANYKRWTADPSMHTILNMKLRRMGLPTL